MFVQKSSHAKGYRHSTAQSADSSAVRTYQSQLVQTFTNCTGDLGIICVTNLGVIWLDPHNFLVRSHGQLLSMTSLVRVLPASAYTSNMVPNI